MLNFRCVDYANIKKGLLFRSEAFKKASNKDVIYLKELGITTIVDLRGEREQSANPDPEIPGINHISLPILKKRDPNQEPKTVLVNNIPLPDMAYLYRLLVNIDRKDVWTNIFDILLNNEGGVLFHCSEGKDRTGVVYAIILSALGIDKSLIYEDYLLTNESPLFKAPPKGYLDDSGLDEETKLAVFDHFKAHKKYMDGIFVEIEQSYGSIDKFLNDCCSLDEAKKNVLKNKYLI